MISNKPLCQLCLCLFTMVISQIVIAAERPNVVIIFIDDMGYGDVGFNGATGPKTPNLDQMAVEGMQFDHFYVGCDDRMSLPAAQHEGCTVSQQRQRTAPR